MACSVLTSCALGDRFLRPETKANQSIGYINAPQNPSYATKPMTQWWKRINDPLLESYVDQLLSENLTLIQAGERVIQANEQRTIQSSALWPTLGSDASAGRSFRSGSSLSNGAFSSFDRIYQNTYSVDLNTSWQIDLFGKIRNATEAAESRANATAYDREAIVHSLIAELVNTRVAIATNQALKNLAIQNADNREKIYKIVQNRYNLGVDDTTLPDVYLAKENFTTLKADINVYERLSAENTYTLDTLLGQAPGATDPDENKFPLLPPEINVVTCVPTDLLDRRPDIKASVLRAEAANADISVAIADLYPSLTLGGSIGFNGSEASNLFSSEQLAGSILSSIALRIFEGGKIRANIRLQESEARELAASYAQTVLDAMREVETALKAEKELKEEFDMKSQSVQALENAEQSAQERYIRGILPLKQYLDIQQRRYNVQQSLLAIQQAMWNNRIALYLALGGDWLGDNPDMQQCNTAPAFNNEYEMTELKDYE